MLEIDGLRLTQSLAIAVYLDQKFPDPPLMPRDPADGAHVRAMAMTIACDIHPLNNLRVLKYLKDPLGHDQATIDGWYRHWVEEGLNACERLVTRGGRRGPYCFGASATLADICLVPQIANARRFNADLSACPTLIEIDAHCAKHAAFADAAPEKQPDAE
jgi:maleylacetoacetate isomerase